MCAKCACICASGIQTGVGVELYECSVRVCRLVLVLVQVNARLNTPILEGSLPSVLPLIFRTGPHTDTGSSRSLFLGRIQSLLSRLRRGRQTSRYLLSYKRLCITWRSSCDIGGVTSKIDFPLPHKMDGGSFELELELTNSMKKWLSPTRVIRIIH